MAAAHALGRRSPAAANTLERPLVAGVVEQVDAKRSRLAVRALRRIEVVSVPPSATLCRKGIAELADFRRGDHVVIELERARRPYVASFVTLLYHGTQGPIVSLDPKELKTDDAAVRLTTETVVRPVLGSAAEGPVSSLRVGDRVGILATHDHADDSLSAHVVFVLGHP